MEVVTVIALLMAGILVSNPHPPTLQEIAQRRVEYMAEHNYRWHPPGRAWVRAGARFEGAGWGRVGLDPHRLPTCLPRRRLTLAADAVAYGRYGVYRIRLWK